MFARCAVAGTRQDAEQVLAGRVHFVGVMLYYVSVGTSGHV